MLSRLRLPPRSSLVAFSRFVSTATVQTDASTVHVAEPSTPDISEFVSDPSTWKLVATPLESEPLLLPLCSLLVRKPAEPRPSKTVVSLSHRVFNHPIRRDILHACVVQHLDGLRQGTASTKTRAEVRGSGRKLRPQKGSGRARLGDKGNPMLRGGGVAFGPKPRDFATQLPRKVREMGMRVALSARLREGNLSVVPSLQWAGPRTKELDKRISQLGWAKTLFVTGREAVPRNLDLASRNIEQVECVSVEDMTVYDVLRWRRVVLDTAAVDALEAKLGGVGEAVLES